VHRRHVGPAAQDPDRIRPLVRAVDIRRRRRPGRCLVRRREPVMPWLSTLMGVSVLGARGVTLIRNDKLAKQFTLLVSLIVLALTVTMAVQFSPNGDQWQFQEHHSWIP